MDDYCGSAFWNSSLTWETSDPYFTPCFENTILTWLPAGFIILFGIFDASLSFKSKRSNNPIPWNIFSIFKCLVILGLSIISVVQLVKVGHYNDANRVDTNESVVRLVSYILGLILLLLSKWKGVRSSGIQFIFWFLTTLCEAILFRTAVRKYDPDEDTKQDFIYFMRFFIFPLVAIQLFLNCWADGSWTFGQSNKARKAVLFEFASPDKNSSFLTKLLTAWFDSMAWNGYKRSLKFEDLWDLNEGDKAENQIHKFQNFWNDAVKNAKEASRKSGKKIEASIIPVLFKCYGLTFSAAGFFKMVQDLLPFIFPELLRLLIAHVNPQSNEESWKGYFYGGLLLVTSLVQTLFAVQHQKYSLLIGMRIRTVLSSAVYRKALVVGGSSKKDSGAIANLMSTDSQKLMDLCAFLHLSWTSLLQISLAIYFLYNTLGPSAFVGLAIMILLIPLNGYIMSKCQSFQMQQMAFKDQRIKLMSEIITGMKVLKLNAWEISFQDKIMNIRRQEEKLLKKILIMGANTTFLYTCVPFLVCLFTFTVYVLTDESHNLNAERAFVSLTLFNIMRAPLGFFPMVFSMIVEAAVSVDRLNKYLNSEEIDPNAVTHNENEEDTISIRNGTFSYDGTEETTILKDINFNVKKGSLTAVVGVVGSGKTTLLSALLGELTKHSGSVNTKGSIGYVSQEAWIQNATLKSNILFNDQCIDSKYQKVIEACALGPDLKILSAGDETEIGEKGINLSGGQKQRVSLARAAYKEPDITLWDDPLSAVDVHVGKHIFDNLIGPNGLLKNSTRVLVTHSIQFLPQVDNIVVLKDGRITEVGTFKELLAKKGSFAEFMSQRLGSDNEKIIDEIEASVIKRNALNILRRPSIQGLISEEKTTSNDKIPETKKSTLIEKEKTETGNIKFSIIADYFKSAGILMAISSLLFNTVSIGLQTYSNIWLSKWSNQATKDEIENGGFQDKDTTKKYLSIYGGLGAGQALTTLVGSVALALFCLNSAKCLHSKILSRVLRAPMSFLDTHLKGRLINVFSNDVNSVDSVIPAFIRGTLNVVLSLLSTIANISYSTPIFLVFIFPVSILYFFIQRFYSATTRQLKRIDAVTKSPIHQAFIECISGASTIRAFEMQEEFIINSQNKIDQNQQAYYPFIASSTWISTRLEIMGGFIIFAAAIFAVSSRDSIDPAIVGLSISSALQTTQLLYYIVRLFSELETTVISVERISEFNTIPQEASWISEKRPQKDWPPNGEVKFAKYETKYREGLDIVLKEINCSIKSGEKIGVVGRTGAGKSTITLALFRLLEPVAGQIYIDNQDITEIGLHDLRSKITIIPQDPVLFSGTLRMNLDPFDIHSDDEIWACLESALLKSYVSSLPQGLYQEVAEEGQNFSVGQRQLVCLARALLRNTKILVLDEATAAVDLETDELIQATIRREFSQSTVITIAHRICTIMDSNRVMVLDEGQIKEFDIPENLLKNTNSMFYKMAKDARL